jgi:hypothetical protein
LLNIISRYWGGMLPELQKEQSLRIKYKYLLPTVVSGVLLGTMFLDINGFHHIHVFFHLPKGHICHPVLSLQMKNGTVCVGFSICHGKHVGTAVLQGEVLTIKFLPIVGLAARVIMMSEVTTPAHKHPGTML